MLSFRGFRLHKPVNGPPEAKTEAQLQSFWAAALHWRTSKVKITQITQRVVLLGCDFLVRRCCFFDCTGSPGIAHVARHSVTSLVAKAACTAVAYARTASHQSSEVMSIGPVRRLAFESGIHMVTHIPPLRMWPGVFQEIRMSLGLSIGSFEE